MNIANCPTRDSPLVAWQEDLATRAEIHRIIVLSIDFTCYAYKHMVNENLHEIH